MIDKPYTLYLGDCLEILPTLKAQSVEAIITDLPYGTTVCTWDSVIPFAPMWEQVKRILKPRGVFVTTSSQPFTSALIMSNIEWFKQELIWSKTIVSGFHHAKNAHLKSHEDVLVFSSGIIAHVGSPNRMTYNPQGLIRKLTKENGTRNCKTDDHRLARPSNKTEYLSEFTSYPTSVIEFDSESNTDHPTQKPVALYEYLIRTYTNPGDTVLDFCFGSGTTAVAAIRSGCCRVSSHRMVHESDDLSSAA